MNFTLLVCGTVQSSSMEQCCKNYSTLLSLCKFENIVYNLSSIHFFKNMACSSQLYNCLSKFYASFVRRYKIRFTVRYSVLRDRRLMLTVYQIELRRSQLSISNLYLNLYQALVNIIQRLIPYNCMVAVLRKCIKMWIMRFVLCISG